MLKKLALITFSFSFLVFHPSINAATNDVFLVFQVYSQPEYGKTEGFVSVMEKQKDGGIKVTHQFPCIYGARGTRKEWEGDRRTPLGMYMVRQIERKSMRNRSSYLKFGGYSIELNYPNWHDQKEGRSGGEITIHGGRVNNTLGCPRVLDGTMRHPKLGKKNIKIIASKVRSWTKVIILEDCPKALLGKKGQRLSKRSVRFWNSILDQSLSREELAARVYAFAQKRPPTSILASSVYSNSGRYSPWNLMDGLTGTAWVPSIKDQEKSVTFKFSKKQRIKKLLIRNGYQKKVGKQDRWSQNARVRKIRLTFDDGSTKVLRLEDRKKVQRFDLKGVVSRKVEVEILDYIKGEKYPHDICISELWFEFERVMITERLVTK